MKAKLLYTILGTTLLSTASFAGLPEGIAAFDTQQYQKAFEEFTYLTDEGNPTATFYLAQMHDKGLGIPKDEKKAMDLYKQADALGNQDATAILGKLALSDSTLENNQQVAVEYLKKSAYNGNVETLYELGEMYAKGEGGVEKEYTHAFGYYLMGALKGDKRAQHKLAFSYLHGRGTTQDFENGMKWLARSANQGYVLAQKDLADLQSSDPRLANMPDAYAWYSIIAAYNTDEVGTEAAKRREEIAGRLGKGDVLIARQRAAREWRPTPSEQSVPKEDLLSTPTPIIPGFNDAETTQKRLEAGSILLTDGSKYGITPTIINESIASGNLEPMQKIIEESVKNGNLTAYAYFGDLMQSSFKNDIEALKWYNKGASINDNYARFQLANFYCEGRGVESPSVPECYKFLMLASKTEEPSLKITVATAITAVEAAATPEEIDAGKKAFEAYSEAPEVKEKEKKKGGAFNFF